MVMTDETTSRKDQSGFSIHLGNINYLKAYQY